ncbi:GNAT family N-acetyltransferase [Streptomyces sp. NPDC048172]|uniref:GNAT family N-acetyltransferase n=1 Tax=Streptomyces sp. NPDC048172 TaxID=3365505 RepID=UPI003713CE26
MNTTRGPDHDDDDGLRLRPFAEDELTVLDRIRAEPGASGSFQWFGWTDPEAWRRQWAEDRLLGRDQGKLLVVRGAERMGLVSWRRIDINPLTHSFCWNIGIVLLPEARGRGVGARAQRMLAQYLFAHSPVTRVEADTEAENTAERRALEKAGFTQEGVLRSIVFRDGRWRDAVLYSILRHEIEDSEKES